MIKFKEITHGPLGICGCKGPARHTIYFGPEIEKNRARARLVACRRHLAQIVALILDEGHIGKALREEAGERCDSCGDYARMPATVIGGITVCPGCVRRWLIPVLTEWRERYGR